MEFKEYLELDRSHTVLGQYFIYSRGGLNPPRLFKDVDRYGRFQLRMGLYQIQYQPFDH